MQLRTISRNGRIFLKVYDDRTARDIIYEKNGYVIKCVHCYGEDYGRIDGYEDERVTSYEEIIPERILVKNNHFAGISVQSDFDYYNGGSMHEMKDSIILIGDASCVRSGYERSFEDHSYWNYYQYYLIERKQMEKELSEEG